MPFIVITLWSSHRHVAEMNGKDRESWNMYGCQSLGGLGATRCRTLGYQASYVRLDIENAGLD